MRTRTIRTTRRRRDDQTANSAQQLSHRCRCARRSFPISSLLHHCPSTSRTVLQSTAIAARPLARPSLPPQHSQPVCLSVAVAPCPLCRCAPSPSPLPRSTFAAAVGCQFPASSPPPFACAIHSSPLLGSTSDLLVGRAAVAASIRIARELALVFLSQPLLSISISPYIVTTCILFIFIFSSFRAQP